MIYIHVPFCRSFCTYCGFYSEICSRTAPQQVQNRFFEDYVDALCAEIDARRAEISAARCASAREAASAEVRAAGSRTASDPSQAGLGPSLSRAEGGTSQPPAAPPSSPASCTPSAASCTPSPAGPSAPAAPPAAPDTLYIGGGTPSVLPVEVFARIVRALGPATYEEFTVEVNPDDVAAGGASYAAALRALGVTRVSMGVQSFDDDVLRWMNRRHDAACAREAFRLLRAAGFDNISVDLIFGLSQLSDELWERTVAEALALRPEHISAYQLSVEPDSALAAMVAGGRYAEASDEQCRRQYDVLCRLLAGAGYVHYEVSNWALPGREAVHNSAYWRRVPYVGLGPAAHSLSFPYAPVAHAGAYATSDIPTPIAVPASTHATSVAPTPSFLFTPVVPTGAGNPPVGASCYGVRSWNTSELARRDADGRLLRWHAEREVLSEREAAEEAIMLALRTARGLPLAQLRALSPAAPVDDLLAAGALQLLPPSSWIRIPEDHFFVSDDIIARLFPAG